MPFSRKRILLLVIVAILAVAAFVVYKLPKDAEFRFEIVDTPAARTQGLSGRENVPENYGMLFVFETPGRPGFWMKDMRVPIDMIWLTADGTIIHIDAAVSPDTYPALFQPPTEITFVLETRAGEALRQGWEVGTVIDLPR